MHALSEGVTGNILFGCFRGALPHAVCGQLPGRGNALSKSASLHPAENTPCRSVSMVTVFLSPHKHRHDRHASPRGSDVFPLPSFIPSSVRAISAISAKSASLRSPAFSIRLSSSSTSAS